MNTFLLHTLIICATLVLPGAVYMLQAFVRQPEKDFRPGFDAFWEKWTIVPYLMTFGLLEGACYFLLESAFPTYVMTPIMSFIYVIAQLTFTLLIWLGNRRYGREYSVAE